MKKKTAPERNTTEKPARDSEGDALFRYIHEKSLTDPFFGAKIGARELTHRIISAIKTERGVHTESLLCALGSLAGYACQAALREQALARGFFAGAYLTTVKLDDGRTFYFGDHLTRFLVNAEFSVWNVAAGGAQEAGCTHLPDISEILKHNAAVLESQDFGRPRVPDKNQPKKTPSAYMHLFWPDVKSLLARFCPEPEYWPMMVSLSAQEALLRGRTLDPCIGLRIVMESAVAASRIKRDDTFVKNFIR